MPSFDYSGTVDFEVYCNSCGNGLCNESETGRTRNRGELMLRVNACEKCVDKARDQAYQEGYDKGYADKEKECA